MSKSMFRGVAIHKEARGWVFSDTHDLVDTTWLSRPCGYCNVMNTPEGHDGCFGRLPGVRNACCGHGKSNHAYIQFTNGRIIRGFKARCLGFVLKRFTRRRG